MTRLAATALLLFLFVPQDFAFSKSSAGFEIVTGRIIAYSSGLVCLNGDADWSMLIHVQDHAGQISSKYIEVQFSLPCKESPKWLTQKPPIQSFRLHRDREADSVLREYFDCTPEPCRRTRMWRLVPGAKHETLPFGQTVPNYRSSDLPLTPAV